jgi:hypothetical protein
MKQVKVNWTKWNFKKFWQDVKCFFGCHEAREYGGYDRDNQYVCKGVECAECREDLSND